MQPPAGIPVGLFAPAEKASRDTLLRQRDAVGRGGAIQLALELMPYAAMVLNAQRQVVYANAALKAMLGIEDVEALLGQRPGDVVQCVHAGESDGGCGTTEFCRVCGAARAILSAQQGQPAAGECRIVSRLGRDLDLRTWARPVDVFGERLTIFTLVDISDERRRESLELIFFHDVLNTAGNIAGLSALLARAPERARRDDFETLGRLARDLIEEVRTQRDLGAMERGELLVSMTAIPSDQFLGAVVARFDRQAVDAGRAIRLDGCPHVPFTTDPTLLGRVLGNMIKNALEACAQGGTVTISCECDETRIRFRVHNPSAMPRDVQLQVFQRFFSTKGPGRGLGTYSMKLLTERYLGGRVSFVSSDAAGTTFTAEYPIRPAGHSGERKAAAPAAF